jgi:prevent-host-death family protein
MRTITASDANRHFSSLLRDVAAGETVVVTSHGRAVATIAPVAQGTPSLSESEKARRLANWEALETRLRSQPARNLGRFDRDSLYDDETS